MFLHIPTNMYVSIEQLYERFKEHPSICTDTRKLQKGDIFWALKGNNFNGNNFIKTALEHGASLAVADEISYELPFEKVLYVEDGLKALQKLAKYHRNNWGGKVIAITGSNGKTTTKELIAFVLRTKYVVCVTKGNLNNHIGVPLTLLSIPLKADWAVVEMGANHQREIEEYCEMTLPDMGIITNIGKAHLEGFGGEEGVKKGKGELYDAIQQRDGVVLLNSDSPILQNMAIEKGILNILEYGLHGNFLKGSLIDAHPFVKVLVSDEKDNLVIISTRLVGEYNLPNILCALAVGKYCNVPMSLMQSAIESYIPDNNRSQLLVQGDYHIILDAYNANPSSMKAAIENLSKTTAPSKCLILGSMAELGSASSSEHEGIINQIRRHSWEMVLLVGKSFMDLESGFPSFPDWQTAGKYLSEHLPPPSHILIKGSRSMQMENMLPFLVLP